VHSTGANNPSLKRYIQPDDGLLGPNGNGNHWNISGVEKCVHAMIGKLADGTIATYQTLPWNHRCWGCGSGKNGSYNNSHIQFEILEDDLTGGTYFEAVYREAVELCAQLCRTYGIDPGSIVCHSEAHEMGYASGHADVMHWFPKHGEDMDAFRAAVAAKLTGAAENTEESEEEEMVRYQKLADIPNEYGFRDVIGTLMDAKIINGDGSDPDGNGDVIDLSSDQVRSLVFEYRGGAFDRKLIAMGMTPAVEV
jgi:hypothetical protein